MSSQMPSLVGRFAANPKPFSIPCISYQDPVEAYYPIPKVITASVTVTIQVAFYMNQTLFRRFKTPQMTTQCTVYTGTSLDVSASSWCAPTNEPIKEHVTTKCRLPEVTVRDCDAALVSPAPGSCWLWRTGPSYETTFLGLVGGESDRMMEYIFQVNF